MGLEYGAVVLGIVLYTDVPRVLGYLNSLYQLGVGIDTYALHASCLELLLVFCIELVAVVLPLTLVLVTRWKRSQLVRSAASPLPADVVKYHPRSSVLQSSNS